MATRPFAVFPQSVKGTILGDLTIQTGCRVELLVSLAPDKGHGLCYDVAFEVTGIRPGDAAFTHRCMESAFLSFQREEIDADARRWRAVGRLAIENVDPPLVRRIMEGPTEVAPVWIVMDGGWSQIRLRPMESGPVHAFSKDIQSFLATLGTAKVTIADLDPSWYYDALATLSDADPGEPRLDDEPLLTA